MSAADQAQDEGVAGLLDAPGAPLLHQAEEPVDLAHLRPRQRTAEEVVPFAE
jgi:hypothetical protein